MKYLILQFIFGCIALGTFAQNVTGVDPSLKFNQRFTKCEKKWVVISKKDTDKQYFFGYIYIDAMAGFTFDLKGKFAVDKNNKYIVDTSITKKGSIKVRIKSNWRNVALLPSSHFKELHISNDPDWVKLYYSDITDTVYHNYRMGFIYNDADECETALTYLKRAYNVSPHLQGVEFEMAFAYNALKQYDGAIKILEPAIQNNPNEVLFYKELGYAYSHKNDYQNAINTYKKGLGYFPDSASDAKGEMAANMASIYKAMGNLDEYKNWMVKAKAYTPVNSAYYKQIEAEGF